MPDDVIDNPLNTEEPEPEQPPAENPDPNGDIFGNSTIGDKPIPPLSAEEKKKLKDLLADGDVNPLTILEKAKELEKEEKRDPLEKDADKFLQLKDKFGSVEAVASFFAVQGSLEKARKAMAAQSKPAAEPAGPLAEAEKKLGLDGERAAALVAKHNLDMNFTDTSKNEVGIIGRPAKFGAEYINMTSWDVAGENLVNAVTLEPAEWEVILNINKVLYGFRIRENEKDVVKARLPAFELVRPAGIASEKSVAPEFEVFDASSISIKETKTDLQRSLAENGFSSHSVEASVSGGAFGVSAGISSALKTASSSGVATTDLSATKEYFATYNFPRARIFMDEFNLKISRPCEAALKELRSLEISEEPAKDISEETAPDDTSVETVPDDTNKKPKAKLSKEAEEKLRKFSERFGHIFATAFQVGGQLQSSKFASSDLLAKETDQRDALRASVAVSFSSTYASGSAKYSRETQSHEETKEQKLTELSTLAWTARGGNTLLCANPPAWAASVAPAKNWRQEQVITLHELIGKFEGFSDIPGLFERIAQDKLENTVIPPITWTGKIKLKIDGKRLGYYSNDTNTIVVTPSPSGEGLEEPIFTVLNGNIAETSPRPTVTSLPLEFPLFLATSDRYARNVNQGNQIPGLWVTNYGVLKPESSGSSICRWSFRKAYMQGRWDYEQAAREPFADGDEVALYCHSLNFGMYAETSHMPWQASRVRYHPKDEKLVALGYGDPQSEEWDYQRSYDVGALEPDKVRRMYASDDALNGPVNSAGATMMLFQRRTMSDTNDMLARNGWKPAIFTVHYVS